MPGRYLLAFAFLLACCTQVVSHPNPFPPELYHQAEETSIGKIVYLGSESQVDIKIYTLSGDLIPSTLWKTRIESGVRYEAGYDLDQGVYLVRIQDEGGTTYKKLVIRTS